MTGQKGTWTQWQLGLVHTWRGQSSAAWSQCVPAPWKWDTWDWSTLGQISLLHPDPNVSQTHGNGTHGTGVHRERSVLCFLVPVYSSSMEMGHMGLVYTWRNQSSVSWSQCVPAPWKQDTMGLVHSGTGAQRERSVFCVLVPVCPSPMEMVHSGTGTQWDLSLIHISEPTRHA